MRREGQRLIKTETETDRSLLKDSAIFSLYNTRGATDRLACEKKIKATGHYEVF